MRSTRKLVLRTEALADLSPGQLGSVVGGSPSHNGCTLPLNQCALSLNPCEYTSPANCEYTSYGCETGVVVIKTSATT